MATDIRSSELCKFIVSRCSGLIAGLLASLGILLMSTDSRDCTLIVLPSGQSTARNGLRRFQSLGVNVLRLLFTYIDAKTFMHFTSTTRWLYHFEVYAIPGLEVLHCSGWTVRMEVAEMFRQRLLRAGMSRRLLKTEYIAEEEFADVLHADTVNGRLTCLSQFRDKITLWEMVAGRGRLVTTFAGVASMLDFTVCDGGFAAIGPASLIVHWTDWRQHVSYEEKKQCMHQFPSTESDGSVRLLASSRFVAVLRGVCVTVFDRDLQVLRTCDLPGKSSWYFCRLKVLVPSATAAFLIVVSANRAARVNAITGDCSTAAYGDLLQIVKADVISVSLEPGEKHFLLILGVSKTSRVLLVNRTELKFSVYDFIVSQHVLTVLTMERTLHLYAATASGVTELKTLAGTMPLNHSLMTYTAKRYVAVEHPNFTSDFLKIYNDEGDMIHSETTELCVAKLAAFRKYIVLIGTDYHLKRKLVAVVNYYEYQHTSEEVTTADIRQRVQGEQKIHQLTWAEEQCKKLNAERNIAKGQAKNKKKQAKR